MDKDRPIIKAPEEAKQGTEPHVTRYVLAYSLGGAIVVVGLLTFFFQFHHG
jgi:hypothetical protein